MLVDAKSKVIKNPLNFKSSRDFLLPNRLWCHQESNRGHKDFQSFALPTELWHLVVVRSGNISFAVAKVVKLLDSASLLEIKNTDKKLVCLLSVLYGMKNISEK